MGATTRRQKFVDQSPEALRLTIVEGSLCLSQFDVLCENHVELPDGVSLTARIIGASHVITFRDGSEHAVHEIVACIPVEEADGVSLHGGTRLSRRFGVDSYAFTADYYQWEDGEPLKLQLLQRIGTMSAEAVAVGLVQTFPVGDLPGVPKTVIVAMYIPDSALINVQTAHSYPGTGVVFTETKFYLNKEVF